MKHTQSPNTLALAPQLTHKAGIIGNDVAFMQTHLKKTKFLVKPDTFNGGTISFQLFSQLSVSIQRAILREWENRGKPDEMEVAIEQWLEDDNSALKMFRVYANEVEGTTAKYKYSAFRRMMLDEAVRELTKPLPKIAVKLPRSIT